VVERGKQKEPIERMWLNESLSIDYVLVVDEELAGLMHMWKKKWSINL
jgi:hypothetical protein